MLPPVGVSRRRELTERGGRRSALADRRLANTTTAIVQDLTGAMLSQLRANSVMPRLVNTDYSPLAASPTTTIRVPTTPTATVAAISPSATQSANTDTTYPGVDVTLDQWYASEFYLTDKDKAEIGRGIIPKRAMASLASVVDHVDAAIFTAGKNYASRALGTAGTTPFASQALAVDTMTQLSVNKAHKNDRHVVADPLAAANILTLSSFGESTFVGDYAAMLDGAYNGNRRIGAQWWENQNAGITHTAGTASALYDVSTEHAVGSTTIACDTGTGTILAGDVVTFGSDPNQYVVLSSVGGATVTSITIGAPGLRQVAADDAAIAVISTGSEHTVSALAFQREAIVFASRPSMGSDATAGIQAMSDPVSGLSLTMEVTRQNYQDKWSLSVLYGTAGVQSEGILQVLG